jgi:hypothetical protein
MNNGDRLMPIDTDNVLKVLNMVKELAGKKTRYELNPEFNPADDGNFNDAYDAGYTDAEIHMARNILRILKGI